MVHTMGVRHHVYHVHGVCTHARRDCMYYGTACTMGVRMCLSMPMQALGRGVLRSTSPWVLRDQPCAIVESDPQPSDPQPSDPQPSDPQPSEEPARAGIAAAGIAAAGITAPDVGGALGEV